MYAIKIKNCSITKPRADALQASLSPHKLPLPAQLVFFFRKVTSSCRRVYHCLGLRSSLLYFSFLLINFFLKTARTNKRSSNVPAAFLVSDRLDQSSSSLLMSAPICWHSRSRRTFRHGFTIRATDMENFSLSKLSAEHSLFLS